MRMHLPHMDAVSVEDFTTIKISSAAFLDNEFIPEKYTCEGQDVNPPLEIGKVPAETKCLALIVDDPDAPSGVWLHWLTWNIPVTTHIREHIKSGVNGINDFGRHGYGGPCPPSGTHHYHFKLYALSQMLDIADTATRKELERAMSPHIVGYGEIVGLYKRK